MKNSLKDDIEDKNIPKDPCDRIAAFVLQEIILLLKAHFQAFGASLRGVAINNAMLMEYTYYW